MTPFGPLFLGENMALDAQREISALRTATLNLSKILEKFLEQAVPGPGREEQPERVNGEQTRRGIVSAWKTSAINLFKGMGSLAQKFWQSTAVGHLRQGFSRLFSHVVSTLDELLGPLMDYLRMARDIAVGIGKFFGNVAGMLGRGLLGIFKKGIKDPAVKVAEKGNVWLKKILSYMKGAEKREKLARLKEKLGMKIPRSKRDWFALIMTLLGGVVFALGAAIGGVAGMIVKPFQVLWAVLKSLKIGTLLAKLPLVGRFFTRVAELFGGLQARILKMPGIQRFLGFFKEGGTLGRIAKAFTRIPIIGRLLPGIMKGFSKLAWPFTIIMGLIDFIKGFQADQGDLLSKIVMGLKAAVLGFLDLPIRMIGWIGDKVLGIFGVEIEGGLGEKIKKGIGSMFGYVEKFFRWIGDIWNKFSGWVGGIWDRMLKALIGAAKNIPFIGEKIAGKLKDAFGTKEKVIERGRISDLEKRRLKGEAEAREEEKRQRQQQLEETKKMNENLKLQEKSPEGEVAAAAAVSGSPQPPAKAISSAEPPDEIESFGMYLYNIQ